jgi:hypothetical protein
MVVYRCDRCKKCFNRKCNYDDHINRKIPCEINLETKNKNEYFCNVCNKKFDRSDTLKRHINSQSHKNTKKIQTNNNNNNNYGDSININGNNNSTIINNKNYYFISPFGQEEINKLSIMEKFSTLLSPENPIVKIILVTNLDPNKPEYHNVGYTDLKSGYGIIFNEKTWEKKNINVVIDELLLTEKNDLSKIYFELNPFLSDADSKEIKEKLKNVENNVEPKMEHHIKSKNNLVTNLKTHFYNNQTLVKEAIKKSEISIEEMKNKNPESWMDRYDFENIDKQINLIKQKTICIYFIG